MYLSSQQQVVIRQRPQSTRLNLSIFSPRTVMACQVTGTVARGDRVISYNAVTLGNFSAVESGMTLLIGTTPGGREVGKIRIKSITASQFTVSENSHIPWAVGQYLTVLRFWEEWPIYPRIIPDPSTTDEVIFYKDYDLVYSNQNSIYGAFINAGEHRAIWAGESSYWSASGTSHLVNGVTLSIDWAFEGGSSITGSTSHTPGLVTYNTPGHYVTRLTVTGSNGSVDVTYRYISVYNRPENSASNNPIKNWSMSDLAGSRSEGGNHVSINVIDEDVNINDGSVIVLFGDDWYGADNISLGGNAVGNSKIFFSGYALRDTIKFNRYSSSIEFDVGDVSALMHATETFAISLEDSGNPTKWYQLLNLNSKRAIYHYLKWHSTTLLFTDFEFIGTDQNLQYFDTDRESIFDAVNNYMRGTLLGSLVSDRQSKLYAEVGTAMYTNPTGSFSTILNISRGDWISEPGIMEALSDTVSYLEVGGVAYSGISTGTFQALLSQAPGDTPNGRGRPDNITGLALASQSQLNRISGNLYAERNAKYPEIDMDMSSGFRNLDIAPNSPVAMDILTTDTAQGIEIHAPYIPDSISWHYDVKNQTLFPTITYKALVNGQDGETLTIPQIPEGGGYSDFGGGLNFGPTGFPPLLGSLFGAAYWQGLATIALVGSGAQSGFFQNWLQLSTNGNFMTIGASGTHATVSQSGIFLGVLEVYGTSLALNPTAQGIILAGGPVPVSNFQSYTGETKNPATTDAINTFNKVSFMFVNAGDVISAFISLDKNTAASKTLQARLSIIKLF